MSIEPRPEHGTGYLPTPLPELAKGLARYGQAADRRLSAEFRDVCLGQDLDCIDQGPLQACTGASLVNALRRLPGYPTAERSFYAIWKAARDRDGFTGNTGAYMYRACDYSLDGVPSLADEPVPPPEACDRPLRQDAVRVDQVLSHQLVPAGEFAEGWMAALAAGRPLHVGIGMRTVDFYRAGDQNGVITGTTGSPDFWHAMCGIGYDAGADLFILEGTWTDWLPPGISLASRYLNRNRVALTRAALETCAFELREVAPEARVQPQPDPVTGTYRTITQHWQPTAAGGWRIDPIAQGTFTPGQERNWLANAVVNPDGTLVYPSVFQKVQVQR